jgi:predicted NBD/HSP70 family sugar kinase
MSSVGDIIDRVQTPIDLAEGPVSVLELIARHIEAMSVATTPGRTVRAVGLAIPGPVDTSRGVVMLPARMPGWANFGVRDWLSDRLRIPVFVEHDANAMAYAEHIQRSDGNDPTVTVKAGTGIGAGVMVGGVIYRGATFAAGDITHYRVVTDGGVPCSCGNRGCLETVASGAALVRSLQAQGAAVRSTRDVVDLAPSGDPTATTAVRQAGAGLGQVLCAVVNFFNPRAVYLGGLLPTAEPFVAAVRAQIYQGSHPLVTQDLTVERTRAGADGVLIGCGRLAAQGEPTW